MNEEELTIEEIQSLMEVIELAIRNTLKEIVRRPEENSIVDYVRVINDLFTFRDNVALLELK